MPWKNVKERQTLRSRREKRPCNGITRKTQATLGIWVLSTETSQGAITSRNVGKLNAAVTVSDNSKTEFFTKNYIVSHTLGVLNKVTATWSTRFHFNPDAFRGISDPRLLLYHVIRRLWQRSWVTSEMMTIYRVAKSKGLKVPNEIRSPLLFLLSIAVTIWPNENMAANKLFFVAWPALLTRVKLKEFWL